MSKKETDEFEEKFNRLNKLISASEDKELQEAYVAFLEIFKKRLQVYVAITKPLSSFELSRGSWDVTFEQKR